MASNCESWDKHSVDYKSSTYTKDVLETPLLEAQFKRFAVNQGGAPWKALDVGCGAGKYTTRLLQAGASLVLANDISASMVEEAKEETQKFLLSHSVTGHAEFHVISATSLSSIPGAEVGTFDLAICVFVFCNLLSKEEVKRVLADIFRMLKPGGKLMWYEGNVIEYARISNSKDPGYRPKEDGTDGNYFEDDGKARETCLTLNSGSVIKFTNRLYTLSTWVSLIVEGGFQITQLLEPFLDPKSPLAANAPDHLKPSIGLPTTMFWECTKPL